jgi:glycosyltransferase involved in cell wall biosynthesis
MRALLVGPTGEGGEGVYLNLLRGNPPPGVTYESVGGFHTGAEGAPCSVAWEVALNRLVRPMTIPDAGFRALRLSGSFDLVHVHAHPVRLAGLGETPLVMSEGSSSAVYLGEYLGWDAGRLARHFRRTRSVYRALGLHDRLLALDRVDRAYVFSDWARDVNTRWGADTSKLEVVAPGFPVPPPVSPAPRDTFTFLFVGGDFERKGGFDLVEAFECVSRRHPEVRLTLVGTDPGERNPDRLIHGWVGEGRRDRVLARLEELERGGLVSRYGSMAWQDVRKSLYPDADAFVMPSLAEGFGFANVEAMSFGLPVISSAVGPIPEVVADGRTGLLVPPGDIDELAAAMIRLVSDRDRARAMGQAGREAFRDRFTLDAFRDRLAAIYERALLLRSPGAG